MAQMGINLDFKLEDFDKFNSKVQNMITKVSKNAKIQVSFDNTTLNNLKGEIDKMGNYISKISPKLNLNNIGNGVKNNLKTVFVQTEQEIEQMVRRTQQQINKLSDTKSKVNFNLNDKGQIQKATIEYTDGMSRMVKENYGFVQSLKEVDGQMVKVMTFKKIGTGFSDNIQRSISSISKLKATLDTLNTKNLNFDKGGQSNQFIQNYSKAMEMIKKIEMSKGSATQNQIKQLNEFVGKLNAENKAIDQNIKKEQEKDKILKQAQLTYREYMVKIDELTKKNKELGQNGDLAKFKSDLDNLGKSKSLDELRTKTKELGVSWKELKSQVASSNLSQNAGGFFSSIQGFMSKMPFYISSTMLWYKALAKVKEGIKFTMDLDKAQTNISMITGMNSEKVQGLTKDYSNLASELNSTTKEMMSGAEEFLRAGRSVEETKGLLKGSTIGSAISGQNTQEVSEQLIAITNGFSQMTEQAKKDGKSYQDVVMSVIDTISTLDNNSATSFAEVSSALTRTSSSAQMAGVKFETLSSYIATVSATTRKSAESIGESFKSIFARFQDIKQDKKVLEDGSLNNVETSLNRVGIALRKDKTHFKDFTQIIDELKPKWQSFNDIQKNDIAKSFAGRNICPSI